MSEALDMLGEVCQGFELLMPCCWWQCPAAGGNALLQSALFGPAEYERVAAFDWPRSSQLLSVKLLEMQVLQAKLLSY